MCSMLFSMTMKNVTAVDDVATEVMIDWLNWLIDHAPNRIATTNLIGEIVMHARAHVRAEVFVTLQVQYTMYSNPHTLAASTSTMRRGRWWKHSLWWYIWRHALYSPRWKRYAASMYRIELSSPTLWSWPWRHHTHHTYDVLERSTVPPSSPSTRPSPRC